MNKASILTVLVISLFFFILTNIFTFPSTNNSFKTHYFAEIIVLKRAILPNSTG